MAQEGPPLGKVCHGPEEAEPPGVVQSEQPGEEEPSEQLAKHAHRKQEGRTRRYPSASVRRNAAARHDHVDMRMVRHRRSPGVEHGGDADARAEVLGIGGDRQHRLRRRLEQQVVDQRLVLERDVGDLGRQREHDVEVADRQQIGLAFGKPCPRRRALALRAVPVAAGVVGDPPLAAVLAGLDVTAERRSAAVLDRRHDLQLGKAQVTCMGGAGTQARRPGRCRRPRSRRARLNRRARLLVGLNRPSLSSGLVTVRTVLVATLA